MAEKKERVINEAVKEASLTFKDGLYYFSITDTCHYSVPGTGKGQKGQGIAPKRTWNVSLPPDVVKSYLWDKIKIVDIRGYLAKNCSMP